MTTVVYRDGVIASDSRITQSDTIVPVKQPKICQLPDGTLFGWCGSVSQALEMIEYLVDDDEDQEYPTWRGETECLHVTRSGRAYSYEGHKGVWIPMRAPYLAIGSGSGFAYGALAHGAAAAEAVKVAIKFDPSSGGPVRSLRLEKKCKTKKSA